jgi:hypothetical protein
MEKLVVIGASNAGGWSEAHMVDYHCSNLVQAVADLNAAVSETPEGIVIDLSDRPELSDGGSVINAGMPGDTVLEMDERFANDVFGDSPSHVFIWPGLNDVTILTDTMHGRPHEDIGMGDIDPGVLYAQVLKGKTGETTAIEESAYAIMITVRRMAIKAWQQGIEPIVGTIPPFSSRLAYFDEINAKQYYQDGSKIICRTNQLLAELPDQVPGTKIIDVYSMVVDSQGGLARPEFSYGEESQSGDILHLSNRGQIVVASELCKSLFGKPTRVIY